MISKPKNNRLSKEQLANLLYNEYQYRHGLIWSAGKLYMFVIASLYACPWISMDIMNNNHFTKKCIPNCSIPDVQDFGFRLLLFPVIAILTTFIGWWHIKCEAARFNVVANKYTEIIGKENRPGWPHKEKRTWKQQLISENMADTILRLYCIAALVLFLFGTLVIIDYCFLKFTIQWCKYLAMLLIPIILISGFCININIKKKMHNKEIERRK